MQNVICLLINEDTKNLVKFSLLFPGFFYLSNRLCQQHFLFFPFWQVSEDLADESGQYYADCAVSPLLVPQASDEALAKQLWEVSMKLTGLKESASQDDAVDG